jgi:hypothetical protein
MDSGSGVCAASLSGGTYPGGGRTFTSARAGMGVFPRSKTTGRVRLDVEGSILNANATPVWAVEVDESEAHSDVLVASNAFRDGNSHSEADGLGVQIDTVWRASGEQDLTHSFDAWVDESRHL